MPITKSAIKALRQSAKKRAKNQKTKKLLKEVIKKTKSAEDFAVAQKAIDKAAKVRLIHKNKAARLKSCLARRIRGAK